MTQSTPLDVDHLRSWIGREETVEDLVTADLVRKFRAILDMPAGDLSEGTPAPHLLHWCLAQPAAATASLGEDGHPQRGGFLPPVPLPRRMWAGGRIAVQGSLVIGETMRRVSRITDVLVKDGRSGTLCFVTVQHEIDAAGRPILSETQDIVYRGAEPPPAPGGPAKAVATAPLGHHRRPVDPSAPLLFRYSALTFNGHRIHYDQPYTTQVEGYPGLVVHGPLQATLLFNYAAELRGRAPRSFSFRGQSPLFDTEPLFLNADTGTEGTMNLWTARAGGPVAMSAEAYW